MRTAFWPGRRQTSGSRPCWRVLLLPAVFVAGCQLHGRQPGGPPDLDPAPTAELPEADQTFALVPAESSRPLEPPPTRLVYQLAVLHVLVPHEQQPAMEKIWNFLREDAFDADTRLHLSRNGLRVGVGHVQWWEPIKATIDAIEGHQVLFTSAIRVPVGFPLALELDQEPHDQTLFVLGSDGVLSGGFWPESRNVLRVSYGPDRRDLERIVLVAVPEVHQQRRGWEWVRTEAGLWQVPRQTTESFADSSFTVTLAPGEFVLLAPSENAGRFGVLGRAFLTRRSRGRAYDSYVFLRPEASRIGPQD